MCAQVGDKLLVGHGRHRIGLIIEVPRPDGLPPYIIKWLNGGHIAMVYPDEYSRVISAAELNLNPVIVRHDGVGGVDARIRISPAEPQDPFLRRLR
jgi:Domain of unknown function (DUF1918)